MRRAKSKRLRKWFLDGNGKIKPVEIVLAGVIIVAFYEATIAIVNFLGSLEN